MTLRKRVQGIGWKFSAKARAKRRQAFLSTVPLTADTTILDLGGGDGSHVRMLLEGTAVQPCNVVVADVDGTKAVGGYDKVHLDPKNSTLPFRNQEFDLVFSNSAIEHVTGPGNPWSYMSNEIFINVARLHQNAFASEIRRVGRQWWVQTPNKHFPVEAHAWLPVVNWLPRRQLIWTLRTIYPFWVSRHAPDWHLLTEADMLKMFPGSRIIREKWCGLTKSITAVKL